LCRFAWISSFPSCIIIWHVLKLFSKSSKVFCSISVTQFIIFFLWSIMIVPNLELKPNDVSTDVAHSMCCSLEDNEICQKSYTQLVP
jgi:hypothetical protein